MNTAPARRLIAVGCSVLTLSACGTSFMQGSLMQGDSKFLEQSPRDIAKAAFDDMRDVSSMRVIGSQETKDYGFTRVDVRLDDTSCTGILDSAGGTIRVLKNSDGSWFTADSAFWRSQAGSTPQADQAIKRYAGQWSAIGRKNPLLDLCDLGAMQDAFALDEDDTEDSVDAGEVGEVGGSAAVPLTGRDGKEVVTVWVAVDAPHHVLKMAPAHDSGRPDALYFEEFGIKVVAESPKAKDIVTIPGS